MVACWPGIGNIGFIAINTLRSQLEAEELGEIEPWDFFYPLKSIVKGSILQELIFPSSKFYFKKRGKRDLILFIGEEQPSNGDSIYARGATAYRIARLVLEVAVRFNCRRIYTSGAAVSITHHELKPRVWAVASNRDLKREIAAFANVIFMSQIEGKHEIGNITGLNGILPGLAKQMGFESMCLMGEIPDYLAGLPFPYPRASRSVLEILTRILELEIDYSNIDELIFETDEIVREIYHSLPLEAKEKIDQRKDNLAYFRGSITEEESIWLKEHLDDLLKKTGGS
jgi:proteasome assembly chaperone (PAC2) family protein